ncbi:MAG: class I SAM-dependent methyltransferase [Gammaproteobacteria bacterium]|nr:class I SAM-dependent methyltransferase [Gammaproteobacteria bacterium]
MNDSTTRFSNRVADYVAGRPSYPMALLEVLSPFGLASDSLVADIGAGTGLFSQVLAKFGCQVHAVEPNQAMREATVEHPRIQSFDGTAERTPLPAGQYDFVFAAQAFHWFDRTAFRAECQRLLKLGGQVVLVWNERRTDTPFLVDYEALIDRFGSDYRQVSHQNISPAVLEDWFGNGCRFIEVPNWQDLNWDQLIGRVTSSSYMPSPSDSSYDAMRNAFRALYDQYASSGTVRLDYTTKAYIGTLKD